MTYETIPLRGGRAGSDTLNRPEDGDVFTRRCAMSCAMYRHGAL
jgi:hypothetical protein